MARKKEPTKTEILQRRIAELSSAIKDIERRRVLDPNREHPSQEYIDGLKFDLRSYQAQLKSLRNLDNPPESEGVVSKVIRLGDFRAKH